jgi:hypothetical protein
VPFTLTVLTLAVALSWVRGGRLRRVADAHIATGWLLFAGVAVQIGVDLSAGRGWLPDAGLSGWSSRSWCATAGYRASGWSPSGWR